MICICGVLNKITNTNFIEFKVLLKLLSMKLYSPSGRYSSKTAIIDFPDVVDKILNTMLSYDYTVLITLDCAVNCSVYSRKNIDS